MIDGSLFVLFLAGALALNVTPGPDVAFTLATSARSGARAGFAAAAGIGAGSLVWSALAAGGLAALLSTSEHALTVIRIAGGLYLIYLAMRALTKLDAPVDGKGAAGAMAAFRSGMATNLLNPKVGIFFLAFLPAFVSAEIGAVWLQTLMLGAIFSFTGFCVLAVVALAAGTLRERLARSRRMRIALNTVAATAFGALGLRLLLGSEH